MRWALEQEPAIAAKVREAIAAEHALSAAVQDVVEACLSRVLVGRP